MRTHVVVIPLFFDALYNIEYPRWEWLFSVSAHFAVVRIMYKFFDKD